MSGAGACSDVLVTDVLSIVLSGLALAISALVAARQLRLARHTNLLPVMIDMFREFRGREFKEQLGYIEERLWEDCPPQDTGTVDLPEAAKERVVSVASFFNTVGLLVAHGVIGKVIPASYMGGSVLRAWSRLAPYIQTERVRRGDPNYYCFFEHLAAVADATSPDQLAGLLKLRKMPEDWTFQRHAAAPAPPARIDSP